MKKDFYLIDEEKYNNLIKFNPERKFENSIKLEDEFSTEIKVKEITKKHVTNPIQKENTKQNLNKDFNSTKSILKK